MRTREFLLIFLLLDIFFLNLSFFLVALFLGKEFVFWPVERLVSITNICWIVTYLIFIDNVQYLKIDFINLFRSVWYRFMTFIALVTIASLYTDTHLTRDQFLKPLILFVIFKIVISAILYYKASLRNNKASKVIIVGDNWIGNQIYRHCIENPYLGQVPLGILSHTSDDPTSKNVVGDIKEFEEIFRKTPFDTLIISLPLDEHHIIMELIFLAEKIGVRPRVVPNWYNIINKKFTIGSVGSIPLLDIHNVPLYHYPNRFWKRALDLVIASFLILLLLPVFLIVSIVIKLESKGPIFYNPLRVGVNGRPFKMYKFRSMQNGDDEIEGKLSTVINDPRITTFGKIMRKLNIDELPQLFNVIKNEMSIVGPRPHRVNLNKNLQQKMSKYMVRHFIKPGITGWAQVQGWRGPTENRLQYMGRTLHDLWYIEHWSFGLDLYILFLTIFGKKSRKNAY